MSNDHLEHQIEFILEMDKLKSVFRRSYVSGTDRKENDAEHSWHVAIMTLVLCDHANTKIDILRVLKMLLIHDIVEIDAGDTFSMMIKEPLINLNVKELRQRGFSVYCPKIKKKNLKIFGKNSKRDEPLRLYLQNHWTV